MRRLKELGSLLKVTFSEWSEDKAPRLAAALAYYTVFSLAPLLVIVIAIAGLVFGETAARAQIVAQISAMVGPQAAEVVSQMITSARHANTGLIATIIGLATLLVGAAGVFGQLHDALNTIWEVAPRPNRGLLGVIKDRFLSFTMVLGIGFLLLVSLVITAALAAFSNFAQGLLPGFDLLMQLVNFVVSFGVITLLFAMLYKVVPDVQVAWRDVWLGATFTGFLFSLGKWLIGLYLGTRGISDAYGAAGSLIVILLWVYYSAQILFFGAEFTQVYANRYGSHIVPERGAIALDDFARRQQGIPRREDVEKGSSPVLQQSMGRQAAVDEPFHQPASPAFWALSAILTLLVGFVGGWVVKRGGRSPASPGTRAG